MKYLKAYLKALIGIGRSLGAMYLLVSFLFGVPGSFYFMYLTCFASLAGPLSLVLPQRKK